MDSPQLTRIHRVSIFLTGALLIALMMIPSAAIAKDRHKTHAESDDHHDRFGASVTRYEDGQRKRAADGDKGGTTPVAGSNTSHPHGHYIFFPTCAGPVPNICVVEQAHCSDGTIAKGWQYFVSSDGTRSDGEPVCPVGGAEAVLTEGDIERAFQSLPVPQAPLLIQPPHGKTLVNLDTIYSTTAGTPLTRTLHLLGHRIDFHITPQGFTWHYGDGHQTHTTNPGHPYTTTTDLPHDNTHRYHLQGTYHPSLDTTYHATYRIDHGPWHPVNGTVTIQGTPHTLTALTATPHLVN